MSKYAEIFSIKQNTKKNCLLKKMFVENSRRQVVLTNKVKNIVCYRYTSQNDQIFPHFSALLDDWLMSLATSLIGLESDSLDQIYSFREQIYRFISRRVIYLLCIASCQKFMILGEQELPPDLREGVTSLMESQYMSHFYNFATTIK